MGAGREVALVCVDTVIERGRPGEDARALVRRCLAEGLIPGHDPDEGDRCDRIVTEGRHDGWAVRAVLWRRGGVLVVAFDDGGRWRCAGPGAGTGLAAEGV